jgi:hypothetical protein
MENIQLTTQSFNNEIEEAIILYEKTIGHFASRTRSMIEKHGILCALEKLMSTSELQKGFKALRDNKLLDKTFEAIIIKYQNEINIDKKTVEFAKFRYDHPYWDKNLK